MARYRWTLALILICLPILATVITAFRVRDLPKSEDSIKLDRKQKCDDCEVTFSHKLHSIKTESDKYNNENLKKTVKQQQIDQHSFKFDDSDEHIDELNILKVKSDVEKEHISASKINLDASNKKVHRDVDNEDTTPETSSSKKAKTPDIKSGVTKSSITKDTITKSVKYSDNRYRDDDIDDNKKAGSLKPKFLEIKNVDQKSKRTTTNDKLPKSKDKESGDSSSVDGSKRYFEPKLKPIDTEKIEHKLKPYPMYLEKTESRSTSKEVEKDNNSDNEDDDDEESEDEDEDDEDDDDDDDGALSSLWETFSMWGLNIDPSLKPAEKKEKKSISKIETEKEHNKTRDTLTVTIENLPKVKEMKKKINVNFGISNLKESIQKPLTKNISPKKLGSVKSDDKKNGGDDNDISLKNRKPKSTVNDIYERTAMKMKINRVDIKSDDDDDDDDDDDEVDFQLLEAKYKFKTTLKENVKKTEPHKKLVKPVYNSDDEDYDSDDEEDDDYDTDSKNEKQSQKTSKSKMTTEKNKYLRITEKEFHLSNESPDDDDDNDDHESYNVLNTKSMDGKKLFENKTSTEKNIEDKLETNKQIAKGDIKTKKSETVKSEKINKDSFNANKQLKTKEDDLKTTKPIAKNQTTTKQLPKKEDKKEQEEIKSFEDKYKKETNKIDLEKDIKSKEKKTKSSQGIEPKALEKKTVHTGSSEYNDSVDGLNMPEIKKEIKAQIHSSREDKKSDKISKEKLKDVAEQSSLDSHIKHLTDALYRRNLLKSEFEDFYAFFPTFAPNFSRIHNPECRRHGQIVLRQLRGTKLWALNMLDATAKIPSGILQGNGIQLGDFDQCVGSRARVQLESGSIVKVQGKYCLARLDVKAEHPELETPVHLAQAKNLIRSRIDDPGHFVPRFSTLSWGICVPDVCNPEDVEVIFKDAVKHYQKTSGVIVRVKVDEQDCTVEETDCWKNWIELPVVLTLSFYGIVVLLVLVATLQDFFARRYEGESEKMDNKPNSNEQERKNKEKESSSTKISENFISFFSLYYTLDKLVAPGTTDDVPCIHGVRAIATIALLIAHKFLPVAVMPYTNRLKITELASSPLWSWCRAGWMFTDCFLLLSGALTAYKASDNETGAPRRLFSRYTRLTPALLAVSLFYAYIWDNLSSGPMWGTFVTKNAEVCQEGWWWNLLYIQNYFGFEEMCAPQTHQLALDMQLTILGGILIWVMQVKKGVYKFVMPALHIVAAYSRYTSVRDHRLTMLAYHGVSVSQLYRTARLSYTSVVHRSTPYLVGLSLGLALKSPAEHGKFLLGIGWISSIALWCLVWWVGADSGSIQYRYSSAFAAQYATLAPIACALAIAWVVYAVHSGESGFLSRFLCCRPLVLISRLSYALYLTQFIVYITKVATIKTSSEFTVLSLIDLQEISAIILSAVLLTVTFVIPMQSLHKVFIFSSKSESSEESKESTETKAEEVKQENKIQKEVTNVTSHLKSRPHLIAHREVLEEIPETEVEYESQRDSNELGGILEEEEEDMGEESIENIDIDDDLEIIEEEQGGEEDEDESWLNRRQYTPRRSDSNENAEDIDEWEWTANGSRNGAQYYRYSR